MALPIVFSQQLAASSATNIVNAVGTIAPGNFTLATTTLDAQRRISFTVAGNESSNTFTIVGLNQANMTVTETITGPNTGTVSSQLDYKTLIRISAIASTAGTVSIGTNGVGASLWQTLNWHATPINLAVAVEVRGSTAVNFTVQHTYDDPNNNLTGQVFPTPFNNVTIANASSSVDGAYTTPITAVRLLTNSGTGTLWFRMLQAGLASP